jgi:hypothetical protein
MPPTLLNSRNSLIRRLEEPLTATHLPLFLYVHLNKEEEEEEEEEEQEIAGAIRPPVEHKISYCSPFYHLLMGVSTATSLNSIKLSHECLSIK